ncbi:hypothetical protein RI054_03g15660 [Pseudoscourfieldia marina]
MLRRGRVGGRLARTEGITTDVPGETHTEDERSRGQSLGRSGQGTGEWRRIGAGPQLLHWIAKGVAITFTNGPPPPYDLGASLTSMTEEENSFMEAETSRLLKLGAWEEIDGGAAHCVNRVHLVPKVGSKKFRLVIDLRPLNLFCGEATCNVEGLRELNHILQPQDFMVALDLTDGYFHLDMAEESRTYMAFRIGKRLFRMAAVPFGWNHAPSAFTKLLEPVVAHLRQPQRAEQREVSRTQKHIPLRQRAGHRHARLRGQGGQAPSPRTGPAVRGSALARKVRKRELAAFAGLGQFVHLAPRPARFHLREIYDVIGTPQGWNGRVSLTKQALRDLRWWARLRAEDTGCPIWRPIETATLHTDSSGFAWGAVLDGKLEARGYWTSEEAEDHITLNELRAVTRAVTTFRSQLEGKTVQTSRTTWAWYISSTD